MTIRQMVGAAVLLFGLGFAADAPARDYQPGMRTMKQQGGIEHGARAGRDYRAPRWHYRRHHRHGFHSHHRRGR